MSNRPEGGDVEATLLRAARSYVRPSESRQRTMMALGLGASASSLAPGAIKAAAGWSLRWKIVGLLATAGVIGGIIAARSMRAEPSAVPAAAPLAALPAPESSATAVWAAPSPDPGAASVLVAPQVSSPPSRPPRAAAPIAPAPAASSLAEEVKMLDRASASLGAHDSGGALAELDAYQTKFPRGSMSVEATVLRIEALRQSGNVSAADALADDFLAKHPNSPLAQRVRAGKTTGGH